MDTGGRKLKVCVIGAGPAGMSALYYFAKLGPESPEVICYEKAGKWGGQWNYSWRTGTDEYGETVCSGIYHNMWIQIPKETMELGHYTFEQHFGKTIQSFVSPVVIMNYLEDTVFVNRRQLFRTIPKREKKWDKICDCAEGVLRGIYVRRTPKWIGYGYWKTSAVDLSKKIRFNTPVYSVRYNSDTDDFTVVTKDLARGKDNPPATFSHVIVASGHFSMPNLPEYKGFDSFHGKIMHSHEFRDGKEFKGKRVLIVGAMYSADDIALQCYKHGADHVIISWRTKPRGMKFPETIEERPVVERVMGNFVKFTDGSTVEVDAIILCTGYIYSFPFLDDSLRLEERLPSLHPENLYKGLVWLNGGNNKLLYLGALKIVYAIPLFDAQAVWIVRYITGKNIINPDDKTPAGLQDTREAIQEYLDKIKRGLETAVNEPTVTRLLAKYFREIADDTGYQTKIEEVSEILIDSLEGRYDHVLDYRDFRFTSAYTGNKAPPPKTKWLESFDDRMEQFV